MRQIFLGGIIMDMLKKFFPLSFKYTKDVANVIIGVLVQLVVGLLAGLLVALAGLVTGWIPVLGALIGIVLGLVGSLIDLYVLAGIVIQLLVYFKVLK